MTSLFGTPSADSSAVYLSDLVRNKQHFFFVRIGDGAIECIGKKSGATCDGEPYSPVLASSIAYAIQQLKMGDHGQVFWGDWRTAVAGSAPKLVDEWAQLIEPAKRATLDYETLLLMRKSDELLRFYRAVREDPRRKLYIGTHAHRGAGRLLRADMFPLPMDGGVFAHRDVIWHYLDHHRPEVILFGAGMGGLIPIVRYWYEHQRSTTCIHLGSALDPLFCNRATRSRQLPAAAAREFFKELL